MSKVATWGFSPDDRYGPWFSAAYDGTCGDCGEDFDEGDRIRKDTKVDGWVGECCAEDED